MIFLGSIANAVAILCGSMIGMVTKKGLGKKTGDTIIIALACITTILGIGYAIKSNSILIVIFSLVFGIILGEKVDIEDKLEKLGKTIELKLHVRSNKKSGNNIADGFVTASLLFCIGSMAVMGALESGINNNHEILYTKSVMDGVISIIFASSLGIGVAFSAVSVFIYQALITIVANYAAPFLGADVVTEMSATGGILLICLAFNIMKIKEIRVANMLPAMFFPIFIMGIMKSLGL